MEVSTGRSPRFALSSAASGVASLRRLRPHFRPSCEQSRKIETESISGPLQEYEHQMAGKARPGSRAARRFHARHATENDTATSSGPRNRNAPVAASDLSIEPPNPRLRPHAPAQWIPRSNRRHTASNPPARARGLAGGRRKRLPLGTATRASCALRVRSHTACARSGRPGERTNRPPTTESRPPPDST